MIADVLVVGGGPAGRALAAACGARGLTTTLLDPAPGREWRATYAAWSDELPAGLPPGTVAVRAAGRAVALTERAMGWEYAVLDVAALRAHLDDGLARGGVTVRTGTARFPATAERAGPAVLLGDGGRERARVVVDATGRGHRSGPAARSARQTAYGLVVDAATAAPLVGPGAALFMDWRADHGERGWPTFLYAVPLGGGAVLLEETSLARRPGLPLPVLRSRLLARLARHGIRPPADATVERVAFAVDHLRHRDPATLGFGAAAPLVHPATGFSVATALHLAPVVADAVAGALPRGPAAALAAARAAVWPRSARIVHAVRRRGLEALLRMPPAEVPAFFEVFLDLPAHHRWAYLTARDDVGGTVAAMNALFARANWRLRRRLVGPLLRGPAPAAPSV